MEYTQWGKERSNWAVAQSLNPCCNGIYSMSLSQLRSNGCCIGLNPCCNGIYSMS